MTDVDIAELAIDIRVMTTRERLDVVERFVGASVATRFADALSAAGATGGCPDDAEIFIDDLHVDCNVLATWDDAALARAFAARVHDELVRATQSGAHKVFRDRTEYLAAAIVALADGRASRCWWFDSFSGLALVAPSNAVRTVVLDEGDAGIAALARLTTMDARRVIDGLNRGDAIRIVEGIASRSTAAALPGRLLWERSLDLAARDDDPNAWLHALVAAERETAGAASGQAIAALESLISVRAWARAAPDACAGASIAGEPILDALERAGVDTTFLRSLQTDTIEQVRHHAGVPSDTRASVTHDTPFGGALLLRVVLDRTDWRKRWQARVRELDPPIEDALAWRIVVSAIGAREAGTDPVLRLLSLDDGVALLGKLDGEAVDEAVDDAAAILLREFARRVPGCADASADWLRTNLLAFPARVTSLDRSIDALVGRPPLDVLLVLAGWKRTQCRLADGRALTLREAVRDR
jgi:hypothetical protein